MHIRIFQIFVMKSFFFFFFSVLGFEKRELGGLEGTLLSLGIF